MKNEASFKMSNKQMYTKDAWEVIKDKSFTAGTPTYSGGTMSTVHFPGKGQWEYVFSCGSGVGFVNIVSANLGFNKDNMIQSVLYKFLGPFAYLLDKEKKEMQENLPSITAELKAYLGE